MMRLFGLTIGSWLAGLAAYLLALKIFYDQGISRGDLKAVLFWSALVSATVLPAIYVPGLFALRRVLAGGRPRFLFPLAASLLGIFPTMLIVGVLGGNVAALLSPEAILFYCLFTVLGVVFGFGFVKFYGEK